MRLNLLKLTPAAFVVALLVGCASPASHMAMTSSVSELPPAVVASPHLKGLVTVRHVTGGKETNPLWTSQVDAGAFRIALQESMVSAGLMASHPSSAKYIVDADLKALNQPAFGLTFDVESTVQYTIENAGVGKDMTIKAVGSASVSDAFVAVERLKVANERSIKENIKAFLVKLSQLSAQ